MVTYYDKEEYNVTAEDSKSEGFMEQYDKYKGMVEFPPQLKMMGNSEFYSLVFISDIFSFRLCLQKQIEIGENIL